MGEDISTGAKIGITLIILCALIAIIFALLTMMKNVTNSGSTQMQSGLDNMLASQYQDYDQKILTGTQLISALAIFDGQPVSLVVRTSLSMKNSPSATDDYGYCFGVKLLTDPNKPENSPNYTATSDAGPSNSGGPVYCLKHQLQRPEGKSYYEAKLDVTNGVYSWNVNTKPLITKGTVTYVRGSAKFLAELIKDPTEEIIGVCFTQQN